MKKILIIFGGLLAVILACGVLLGPAYRRARRDVPHGRAVILDPRLANQPNAADIYQQALPLAKSLTKEESAVITAALRRPWTDTDGSLASLLRRQAPLLALARQGAISPRFELGTGLDVISYRTPLPNLTGAIKGADLLLVDGKRLLAEGHPAEALDNALAVLAMAAQCDQEKNFALIDQLVSMLLVRNAFPLLSNLIATGLDEPRLQTLRNALEPLAETDDAGRGIQQELAMGGIVNAEVLAKAWYIPPWILKKMMLDVVRAYKDFADAVADGARRNVPGIQESEIARRRTYGERPDSKENFYFCLKIGMKNPQAYGDCMIAYPFVSPVPHYPQVTMKIHFGKSLAAVLLAAVGVRLYEWSRHMPPPTLQDLVPNFLPQVPRDNFDEFRPLRYALGPNAWTVYGIGPDRKDDGGISRREVEDEDWSKPVAGDVVVTAGRLRLTAPRRSRGR